jgi:pyridoxine kinase
MWFTGVSLSVFQTKLWSHLLTISSFSHTDVGNKAAVFPLQLLGFDVDFINSVNFSNHTGYENGLTGDVMNGDQLQKILQGLEQNNLLEDVGYMLTGYIGSVSFCEAVLDVLKTLRKHNENVRFVCDPVLGDDGRFYVPKELVKVYRETIIPAADVVTPNQFEVEQLTGLFIKTMDDARKACDALHNMGPSTVFITSVVLAEESESSEKTIAIVASRRNKGGEDELWRTDCPMIPGKFTGTGDLTASLLLGHLAKDPDNLPLVMEKVINTMYVIIQRTHESVGSTIKSRELKLIQSKHDIENPPSTFKAKRI